MVNDIITKNYMNMIYKDYGFIADIGKLRVIYIVDDTYLLDNTYTFKKEKHDIY